MTFPIYMQNGWVMELRFNTGDDWLEDLVRVGSSVEDVQAAFPRQEIVQGQQIHWKRGVLYRDAEGREGRAYDHLADVNARMFFANNTIVCISLTRSDFNYFILPSKNVNMKPWVSVR